MFDAPASEYPLARRPSLRPPSSWTDDGDQLVTGHDGCNAYSLNGRWTPSGSGWQVAVTDGGGTSVDCGDRPTIAVENGSVLSLTSEGLLSVIAADGNEYLFRDIRAATLTDLLQSPLADLPRRWELDPGFVLEVKLGTSPEGRGVITMGSCGVDWWPVGNEWIGAGPVPQDCVAPADSPSAGSLLQLLDTGPGSDPAVPTVERPITVGINPERNVLYLADADGTIVLRLTRLDADPTPTTGAGDGDVIVEDALGPGAWTGAQTSADGSTLLLFFVGAAEYRIGDPCTARYVATVTESATEVRVAIHSGQPARPDGAVDGCRSIGYSRSLTVELAQPFGDRDLVVLGEPRSVFDGSTLARPKWIPDGWEDGPEQPAGIGPDLAAWSRSWAPPHPEPIDGACVPGSSGFLLFEGSASIVDALPLEVGETEAGTYDVNGSNATFSTQPDLGVTRLTWTSDERGYVLKSSPTCVGDEPPDLDTMLRFARELLP